MGLGLNVGKARPEIHDVEPLGVVGVEVKEMTVFLEDNFWSEVVVDVQVLIGDQDRRHQGDRITFKDNTQNIKVLERFRALGIGDFGLTKGHDRDLLVTTAVENRSDNDGHRSPKAVSGNAGRSASIDSVNHPRETLAGGIVEPAVNPDSEFVVFSLDEVQISNEVRQIGGASQDDPLLGGFTGLAFDKDAHPTGWKVPDFNVGAELVPYDVWFVVARVCARHAVEKMIQVDGIIGIPPTRKPG